jgi:PAS domain S-box-containing protein
MSTVTDREASARAHLRLAIERLTGDPAGPDRQFREAFDHAFGFAGLIAPDGTVLEANRTLLDATELDCAEVIGGHLWDAPCWPSSDVRQRLRAAVAAAAIGGVVRYDTELHARGESLTVDLSLKPIRAPDGEVVLIVAEARDVTAKARADDDLRESEERFNRIVSIAADAIVSVDESHRIALFNRGAETIFGYRPEEVIGRSLDMLLPEALGAVHRDHLRAFRESATVARRMGERQQIFGRRKSGEVFPAEASISKTVVAGKQVFTAVVRDVSDRWAREEERGQLLAAARDARDEAEAARSRVAYLAEASDVLAASLDLHDVTSAVARLLVPREAMCCVIDLLDADDRVRRVEALVSTPAKQPFGDVLRTYPRGGAQPFLSGEALRTGQPQVRRFAHDEELASLAQDAEHLAALMGLGVRSYVSVPLLTRSRTLGAVTVLRDGAQPPYTDADAVLIQELARRAAMAIDNARLFADAQDATRQRDHVLGIVSHDLRNPLSAIRMCTTGLAEQLPPDHRHLVETIRSSTDWMQRLIRDLLDITSIEGGRLSIDLEDADPASIALRAFEMFERTAAEKTIALDVVLEDRLPAVRADGHRVVQVLANLLTNAVKFTERGGHVTLRVDASAASVAFSVTDDGSGIAPEDAPRIFDRFWHARQEGATTRPPRGTGLGLAIAKGIVDAHGGRIWVESTRGVGSAFRFTIPRVRAALERDGAAVPSPWTSGAAPGYQVSADTVSADPTTQV